MLAEALNSKLQTLPSCPGCYLFKDRHGVVVYVGKATNLRSRVRSYFQQGSTDSRMQLPLLLRSVADLDTIVTASEKEATILEDSLIKQHKPRFNIKLRDDKSYLSIRIDLAHPYPRLELVRRPSPDGARYFGPHHSATSARRTLNFINKHFQLRICSDQELAARKRPCLQYHIKRCPAPCVLQVDRARYAANVQAVMLFLEGKHDEVSRVVEQRMREAAAKLDYERAAVYRDQLRAVDNVRETQRVVAIKDVDQDVLGLHRDADLCELVVVFVRSGRVVDTAAFPMRKVELPDEEVIGAFIAHFYGEDGSAAHAIPDEVLVPVLPESPTGVAEWLSERRGRRAALLLPKRGDRAHLLKLAQDNARHAFEEKRRTAQDIDERLLAIQRKLRLATLPRVIECCDISHLGGGDTVGGLVRFVNGEPYRPGYRTFHVRNVREGDDYAAMYHVLARRFRRAIEAAKLQGQQAQRDTAPAPSSGEAIEERPEAEADSSAAQRDSDDILMVREPVEAVQPAAQQDDEPEPDVPPSERDPWQVPDLLVVDGGRGQLKAAMTAAHDLGLHELAIVGLAKERENVAGEVLVDRVYVPGQKNGIPVKPHTPLILLARARDESHRYANYAREKLGRTHRFQSALDDIKGIGAATRQRLLTHIGGVQAIREATDEQLLAVPGINKRHVQALRAHLGPAADASTSQAVSDAAGTANEARQRG